VNTFSKLKVLYRYDCNKKSFRELHSHTSQHQSRYEMMIVNTEQGSEVDQKNRSGQSAPSWDTDYISLKYTTKI